MEQGGEETIKLFRTTFVYATTTPRLNKTKTNSCIFLLCWWVETSVWVASFQTSAMERVHELQKNTYSNIPFENNGPN